MLYWAVVFLIIAIVAGILGFGGIAGMREQLDCRGPVRRIPDPAGALADIRVAGAARGLEERRKPETWLATGQAYCLTVIGE